MEARVVIGVGALLLALLSGGVFLYFLFAPRRSANLRNLMGAGAGLGTPSEERARLRNDPTGKEFERLKAETKRKAEKKLKPTLDERFFHAGIFSDKDKREFHRMRLIVPLVAGPVGAFLFGQLGFNFAVIGLVMGILVGLQIPFSILDRKIKWRGEEIMFYLPLVVEQISIGVSSSLDIGPCLQRVVAMADERDSHNVVTELLRHAQYYVKSGVSLEDALLETGRLSGHTELKHAFMSLSQVAKHGGEITRQLQELADAVSAQREARIEAKIKKLELEATGPVAMVFLGFLVIMLVGFGLQVVGAFN
ncbi:MAG: type II secretion system F family protein [Oligoflexia bacterium]|nr:type II secretion system F family protein [Oligoflexia bacterium]